MSTNETHGNESIDPRTERALTECMSVLPEGGEIYTVVGQNGRTYTVDGREKRCTCPDHKHRRATCKHLRRVAFARGARPVPAGVDGVDELLGEHTESGPQIVATDGGILNAGDDGERRDAGDQRPADCECSPVFDELPCWPCYRDGFERPNPNVDEE